MSGTKKLNIGSKGFSLVEIIVAVVIMGIIVVPLLHTFLTGARTAQKSAQAADESVAAQSLIELVKAKGVAEVYKSGSFIKDAVSEISGDMRVIELDSFSSGGRDFSALISIKPADVEDNSVELSKSNAMDAVFSMGYADDNALNAFRSYEENFITETINKGTEEEKQVSYPPSEQQVKDDLTRRIVIHAVRTEKPAAENESKRFDYTVTVTFCYTGEGLFSPQVDDNSHEYKINSKASISNVSPTEYGDAAFSIFIYYNAFYKDYSENISIQNNYEDLDFNVFLVNIGDDAPTKCNVEYRCQRFDGDDTRPRVFANFDLEPAGYSAYKKDALSPTTVFLSNELVEKAAQQRRFDVNVKLFDKEGGEELLSFDAQMLA